MNPLYDTNPRLVPPRQIESLDQVYFYHTMDVPGFGVMPGHWDLRGRFTDYTSDVEVAGKSVLDVGAATGFLSFEAERLGASRVLSFDMSDVRQQTLLPFKDKPYYIDHEEWVKEYEPFIESWKNGYWLCHRLLNSHAEVYYGNIYALPPALGAFDVVIVGSVLEHLSDQVSALGSIARLAKETLVIVTPLIETDERIARFEPTADNSGQDYTWWTYSIGIYREVLAMVGFRIVRITHGSYYHEYAGRFEDRPTLIAERVS